MTLSINDGGRLSPFTADHKLSPLFAQETEKTEQNQLFHLISLQTPDQGGNKLHIVDSNFDVTFGGIPYVRFPVKFQGASISSDGTIDKASIIIANVSREIMYYVEEYNGLRNMRVWIKTVYAQFLDETYTVNADGSVTATPKNENELNHDAYIEDEYYIDNYTANEQTVTFQLDPIIDVEIKIPRRRYMQDSCYWMYKDAKTCKFSAANPKWAEYGNAVCPKNFDACKLRNNEANFGGFPGVSANRRIFL